MAYERLKKRLESGEIVILDGGTGTELQRRGAPMDPAAWCGTATLENDALLSQIHADYIAAGAEVITANTYASSRLMLSGAGYADKVEEINRRAVAAALDARESAGRPEVAVAGSLSHMVPVGPGTAAADPSKLPSRAQMDEAFGELAEILAAAGCDLIILEMMYDPARIEPALEAALSTGLPIWFGYSARRAGDGQAISFRPDEEMPLERIVELIPERGVDAAGVMHTPSDLVEEAMAPLRERFEGALMAYPDTGYFEMPDWRFVDVISPEDFGAFCGKWIAGGIQVIGGCCGLGPEHIEAAARARAAAG